MKARAGVVGLALLLTALPARAQRGGGHFGGGRFSGHFGAARVGLRGQAGFRGGRMAPHVTPIARVRVSGVHLAGTGSRGTHHVTFVPLRDAQVSTRIRPAWGQHIPARPQSSSIPVSRLTMNFPPSPSRMPLATASSPHTIAPPVLVNPTTLPLHLQRFFDSRVAFFFGDGFFCPVFFDGFVSPFCPICDFGVANPFFFHRPFFSPFIHRRFFGGFFTPFMPVFSPGLVIASEQAAKQAPAEQPEAGKAEKAPEAVPTPGLAERGPAPLTLLMLTDGSAYGVIDYWLDDGRLHYLTPSGRENSLLLERIDLYGTVKANWERGIEFTLRPQRSR